MLLQVPNHIFSNCTNCTDNLCAFRLLHENELISCGGHCYWAYFEAGEKIIPRDKHKEYIVFLRKGAVKQLNSDACLIQIFQQGTYLNLNKIVNNKEFLYKAITAVNVCFIEQRIFHHFLKTNAKFAYEIICSEQIKEENCFVSFCQLLNKNAIGKIAAVLIYFSRNIYKSKAFKLHLRRREFAQMLGVGRETVSKGLSKLSKEQIIKVDGKNVEILQLRQLEELADID